MFKSFSVVRFRLVAFVSLITLMMSNSMKAGELSEKTDLGGYGELHLNYVKPHEGVSSAPVLDFHRWVLLLNHRWTEKWTFASEVELEHNFI